MDRSCVSRHNWFVTQPNILPVATLVVVVFALPFFVPVHEGSISYLVGFSNRTSQFALLVGSALIALWTDFGRSFVFPRKAQTSVPNRLYAVIALAGILGCGAVWVFAAKYNPEVEASYFLDRYQHLLHGESLYRDFSFDYGPLLFLPTAWLSRVFKLDLSNAYYLCWTLQWFTGTTLIVFVLNRLRGTRQAKGWVFFFCSTMWLTSVVDGGLNYTPLRFIASSAFAVICFGLYDNRKRQLWTACSLVAFATLFLYSPEQGITFALATTAFVSFCDRDRQRWWQLSAFVGGCTMMMMVGARFHLLDTIRLFGGGDYDLPLLCTPSTLVWMICVLIAICLAVRTWKAGNSLQLEVYVILLGLAALPAAMGRADPGHLFINTMPALMVATLALLSGNISVNRALALSGWSVTLWSAFALHFLQLRRVVIVHHSSLPRAIAEKEADHLRKSLPAGSIVLAPFGFFSDFHLDRTLPVSTGRFTGYTLVSRQLPSYKISELNEHRDAVLIVPSNYHNQCAPIGNNQVGDELQFIFGGAIHFERPRLISTPTLLCTYIDSHYAEDRNLSDTPDYLVLRRSDPSAL